MDILWLILMSYIHNSVNEILWRLIMIVSKDNITKYWQQKAGENISRIVNCQLPKEWRSRVSFKKRFSAWVSIKNKINHTNV